MTEKDFVPLAYLKQKESGKVAWKSPSNIALIKYWGKKKNQIPANPSISFTLDICATTTAISYKRIEGHKFSFDLLFEGKPREDFKPKIKTFFSRIEEYLPFLKRYHFTIETSNSFPHSSGIASSASGMSALALCLMSVEKELNPEMPEVFFIRKASFLSRLGSGSACRSLEGGLMQWGNHKNTVNSSDLYAIKYPYKVHSIFKNYCDTILLVAKGQKQLSSTLGHNLMYSNPFAEQRFAQANSNLSDLQSILADGNLDGFIKIVESEALILHAMMMCCMPYFVLMKPNTLKIINKIWEFREAANTHICFTLDAGANVHVLYPATEKDKIYAFIKDELVVYCENAQYICDGIGFGAKKIKEHNGLILD